MPATRKEEHMQCSHQFYDPVTVALMGEACDAAIRELQARAFFTSAEMKPDLYELFARRIMAAIEDGERDLTRLKAIALQALDA
jgi:hypothetical protein